MFLWLDHGIFRTLTYLMTEAYWKPCQISKMNRHFEKPGIVRTLYSGIFMHIGTFSNIQVWSGILSDVNAYWGIFRHYLGILSNITFSELCITIAYTVVPYSEPWHSYNPKHLQKPVKNLRWSGIFRALT